MTRARLTRDSGARRRQLLAVALPGAVLVAALVFVSLRLAGSEEGPTNGVSGPESPDPHATPVPASPPAPLLSRAPAGTEGRFPTELLYAKELEETMEIRRMDLGTGKDRVVAEVPAEVVLAPMVGDHVAYVTIRTEDGREVAPSSDQDGTPVLILRNMATGKETRFEGASLGSPNSWSWDGQHLLVSTQGGLGRIDVADMELEPLDLPPAIEWTPIGWADERLVLFRRPGEALFLVSPDGALAPAPTPDGELRSVSPQRPYVFAESHEADAVFQPLDGGTPSVIDMKDWIFGQTYWTRGDRVFGAVASGHEITSPSVVLVLDPEGQSWEVPNTEEVVRAIPKADGEGFVLARGKTGRFWSVWACRLDGECRESPGVVPLGTPLLRVG